MKIWVLLLLIPGCRLLINLNGWRYLSKVCEKHREYIDGIPDKAKAEDKEKSKAAAQWLTSNLVEIKRRVRLAGVNNPTRTYMEPAGYGRLVQQSMSVLDNLLFHNQEVLIGASHTLKLAAGHYKTQAILSVNPIYWLEALFFLPKQLVSASGIEVTSKVADVALKIAQVIYWVAIILTLIFNPEVFKVLLDNV